VKTPRLAALGLAAVVAVTFGVNELIVLGACGLAMALIEPGSRFSPRHTHGAVIGGALVSATGGVAALAGGTTTAAPFGLVPLFLIFAKIGAILFGSGYVLLAFLRADFVDRLGWLTEQQLLDAIAVGQVTPGPVFTTATFIGYVLGGPPGAVVATVGIFLPAFVFVALSGPLVPRLRRSKLAGSVLDGVNVASLALMAVVSWQLGRAALVDTLTITIAAASALALLRFRLNSAWLIVAGGALGWLATW
jgi:chromate transporter